MNARQAIRNRMRRAGFATAAAAALALNACTYLPPTSGKGDFIIDHDVVFTPPTWPVGLVADFHKPDSATPTPAVLLIHGGGWTRERRGDMDGIARILARRGYFVMNTTYRLTPDWKFPAQSEDVAEALRYLRANAARFNLDPDRIATFGYSAGGHLAALAGMDRRNRVKAVVAGGAPADLSYWPEGELTMQLLGGPLKGNENLYQKASPVWQVRRGSPPVFLYHGTADDIVPPAHPEALVAALRKNRIDHEVYWIEGRSHVFAHLFPADAIEEAVDFLDAHLKDGSRG
jgi:acetyl esterase/lipase